MSHPDTDIVVFSRPVAPAEWPLHPTPFRVKGAAVSSLADIASKLLNFGHVSGSGVRRLFGLFYWRQGLSGGGDGGKRAASPKAAQVDVFRAMTISFAFYDN